MKRLSSLRALLVLLLPLFFVISACDSGGANEEEVNHEFSFEITPTSSSNTEAAVPKISEKDLNGYSFFVDTDDIEEADEQAFVIYFSGNESLSQQNATDGLFGFVARQSAQPESGEYTITDGSNGQPSPSEFIGLLDEDPTTQSSPFYVIQNGTLDLSTSNDNEVSGTITGTATAYTFTNSEVTQDTVEVSGSFTAKNLDTYVPFESYTNTPDQ